MRKAHHLIQGSDEWKAHRATPGMFNGSELSAIMGMSSYATRSELLRQKATGVIPEVDAATQHRFDDGHENEALARPIAEDIIGDDLSAMVMTDTIDGVLFSVSLDGITQGYDTTFEHKTLNLTLATALDEGTLPDEYHPQCEAGLMVSGAARCLFMASRGGDNSTARHYWYEPNPGLRPRIIAACKQFAEDLANYQHVEQTVAPVAAPIEALPALAVSVSGSISLTHNLERFGQRLSAFVGGLNAKPETDQDFVDLDAAVKVLKEAEAALDAAESNALAQTTTIADMCNLVAMYRKVARDNRLMFEKIVKQEKENRRTAILNDACVAIAAHVNKLNERIGGRWMPLELVSSARFAEAIKGLKSLDSMRDKVATALANAKIEANEIADTIQENVNTLADLAGTYQFLFADRGALLNMENEAFKAIVSNRVRAHQDAEAEKAEAAKKAEEARIATAVEAERKAGEARAAAAIEAERMAEAKRAADAAQEQAAKPAAYAVCELHTENAPAATQEEKRAAVVEHQDEIAAFMASREWGKDANKIRAALVEFVKFQAERGMKEAA